jgi:hypothetical protein
MIYYLCRYRFAIGTCQCGYIQIGLSGKVSLDNLRQVIISHNSSQVSGGLYPNGRMKGGNVMQTPIGILQDK